MRMIISARCAAIAALVLTGAGSSTHTAPAHLRIHGTRFIHADGRPFHWRGITAFRLLQMLARGRTADVAAYLDWCSAQGLTVVRVLTMAEHLFALEPEDGRAALPRLLAMAADRGLHVEIVALADTAVIPVDIDRHVREVGAIAAKHPNALVELANEPDHPTQAERVHDSSELARLARLVPEAVPVALGSAETDDRFAGGDYATFHFPRLNDDRGWGHVSELANGVDLLRKWRKPVVNDEPIGAGVRPEPGSRDDSPERFRAAALLSAIVGMGVTFHYEAGLNSRVPEGRQRECFDAWREAWTLLPEEAAVALTPIGEQGSPVRSVTGAFTGAHVAVDGDRAWLLVFGTRGDVAVTWGDDWRPAAKKAWSESIWWPATRER